MRRMLGFLTVIAMVVAAGGCGGGTEAAVTEPPSTSAAATSSTTAATTTTLAPTTTPAPTTTSTTTTSTTTTIPMLDAAELVTGNLPVSGQVVSEAAAAPIQALADFMDRKSISAGVLAISRDGVPVASVGIGWLDAGRSQPVVPDTPMRIASISKPITRAAVRLAAPEFGIGFDDAVWCVPGGSEDCWLDIVPPLGDYAEGLGNVTVRDLIIHEGGWDRYASFDPMFESIRISDALGIEGPPEQSEVAAYMASRPLDFQPGSRSEYSNFGYLLLGLVIEEATGMDLVEYLHSTVFETAGNHDVYLGTTLPEERDPREPAYYCSGRSRSVFDPGTRVCWPDGGWYLEAMEAHGGLVATAPALIGFLDHFCIDGKAHDPRDECGDWTFFGSLDGTLSLVRQFPDGTNVAVILNRRAGVSEDGLLELINDQIASLEL